MADLECPCGTGSAYDACCGPLHEGRAAPTALRLMRSRYSAYVIENEPYLLQTWHESTRPESITFVAGQRWTGLDILGTERGKMLDDEGTVTFAAHFVVDGVRRRLVEASRFVRVDRRWVYVDAISADLDDD